MLAPPPTADVEQDRARVSSEMQQIYTEAERAVDDEIERLDVAKKWAEGEMDRITAVALQKLEDGVDPECVETQLQIDLEAVNEESPRSRAFIPQARAAGGRHPNAARGRANLPSFRLRPGLPNWRHHHTPPRNRPIGGLLSNL